MPAIDVDNVFFINLDFRTDRLDHIKQQVKSCKWGVTRISATRLNDGDLERKSLKLQPQLAGKIHVASIWLSHRDALSAAIAKGRDGASILLEDDVKIADNFWTETLKLPDGLPDDWEIIFLSPRYRVNPNGPLKGHTGKKWLDAPSGDKPVLLKSLRGKYIMTGAHFVVFRNNQVIQKVLDKMSSTSELYDVDRFYLAEFNTYGIDNKKVGTGHLGSDHH